MKPAVSAPPQQYLNKLHSARSLLSQYTMSRIHCNRSIYKGKFGCYEAKIEESEKVSSRRESNPGHLACAASVLPLSYDNQTTTSPHNPLYVLHRWTEMPLLDHKAVFMHNNQVITQRSAQTSRDNEQPEASHLVTKGHKICLECVHNPRGFYGVIWVLYDVGNQQ